MKILDIDHVTLIHSNVERQEQVYLTDLGIHIKLNGCDCDFLCDIGSTGSLKHYRRAAEGCYKFVPVVRYHYNFTNNEDGAHGKLGRSDP